LISYFDRVTGKNFAHELMKISLCWHYFLGGNMYQGLEELAKNSQNSNYFVLFVGNAETLQDRPQMTKYVLLWWYFSAF
jgi:hypothetical protein